MKTVPGAILVAGGLAPHVRALYRGEEPVEAVAANVGAVLEELG